MYVNFIGAPKTTPSSKSVCVEQDMIYTGTYIIHVANIQTWNACQEECVKHSNCKYFVWQTDKQCYSYSDFNSKYSSSGAVSGEMNECEKKG